MSHAPRGRDAAHRFAAACAAGGAPATFVFAWMITHGRWNFFAKQTLGDVQDAQARSLFHGRWNVPFDAVGFEGFKIHGHYYTYFGLFPAVLRMPVLLVTNRLDGKLTILSMLLGLVLLLAGASHLHWRLRGALRGDRALTWIEAAAAGTITFLVGAGSIVTFLGSQGLIYHEVELWGVTWAVLAADALVVFAVTPSRRAALFAVVAMTCALMTRVSVGLGAVAAVAIVAGAQLLRKFGPRWTRALGRLGPGPDASGRSYTVTLIVGIVVALALYAAVNDARFGTLFRLPLDKQVFTQLDAQRRAALAHNGGSLFGARFVPTNLLQYVRPDAVRPASHFPWVNFPKHRAKVIGNVVFDTIDRSSSLPASMPGFVVLGIVGLVALARPRRFPTGFDAARLWAPIVGGALGTVFVLTIAFVAHRYLADFFPALLFAALIGVQRVAVAVEHRGATASTRAGVAGLVALCLIGGWISFGLGRVYQRPVRPGDPEYTRGVPTSGP